MSIGNESAVGIALVFPELLGTYGDGGNAVVLAQRLRWRGLPAEIVRVGMDDVLPHGCDIYVLGGGEDAPQMLATTRLAELGLARAVDRGATVFAVCAGLQVLGHRFTGSDGKPESGLGIVDCTTRPKGERQIGELVVEPTAFDLPLLTGFENHGGITDLGPSAAPLGRVKVGHGNGVAGVEGVVSGHVVGTYLHGPALARNPALADLLLSWVTGPLEPLDEPLVERLRTERLRAALGRPRPQARRAARRTASDA
jgi:CobQ-like glutamine amidotransferase family enzyme